MPITDYDIPAAIPDTPAAGSVGDFAKTFGAGAADIGSNLAAFGRYTADQSNTPYGAELARGLQEIFGAGADAARDAMSPETRKLASATLTSPEFWEHPALATALKATGMSPSVIALAVPGGLMADTVAATMAAAGSGAVVNAGTGIDEFYKKLDAMSDKDLQLQSPKYAAMREVLDEPSARTRFMREAMGWAPAINALVGAGAAVVGPAGTAARRLAGGTGNVVGAADRGALAAGGVGAVEGAVGNAAQAGAADYLSQQADVEASFAKDMDHARTANAALEGGALGGLMGGLAGAALGHSQATTEAPVAQPAKRDAGAAKSVSSNAGPNAQPQTGRATAQPAQPVASPEVGNPQSAPTGSSRDGAKPVKGKGRKGAPVEATPVEAPDAAQTAAIAATEPSAQSPDVVAAAQRLAIAPEAQPAAPAPAPVPAPQVQAPVTPEVSPERVRAAQAFSGDQVQPAPAANPVEAAPAQPVAARPVPELRAMVPEAPRPAAAETAPVAETPARTGRVLPDLRQPPSDASVQKINVKENLGPELTDEGEVARGGKRYSAKEKEARDAQIKNAEEIVQRHAPGDDEGNYLRDVAHRDRVIARARAMVQQAEESGVKIQKVLKKSEKGNALSDQPSTQILTAAKALTKVAERRKAGKELTDAAARFKEDEALIRAGYSDDVLARRRAEGDQAMNRRVVIEDSAGGEAGVNTVRVADNAEERTVKSKTGEQTTVTGAKAASEVRRPQLSEEEKARYAAMASKSKPERPPTKAPSPQEALRVNRNPTEAQKAAGNYKKGHRSVEGLPFTIENPKGAVRRGRGPEGEWSVRMPADYGYIRRTTGADGDHIDAYDGRSGDRYFIVDQLDHRTGEFDEHKVMLRFKDEAAAREAYKNAFSDGNGEARMGHMHEVSLPELKEWLHGDTTQEPHLHTLVRDMDRVNFDDVTHKNRVDVIGGPRIKVERTARAKDLLSEMDFSKVPGVGGVLGKFFASRLQKLAGDIEVHYVTQDVMDEHVAAPENKGAIGMHLHSGDKSQIFISTSAPDGVGYGTRGHVLLHELAHRVTVREIENVPGAERAIKRLALEASNRAKETDIQLRYGDQIMYGFANTKEFIAEAFSNPHFQEFLAHTPIPQELAGWLGLHKKSMSIWDMFRGFVKKAIEKVTGEIPRFDSVLDGIMRVGERLTNEHAVAQAALKTGEEPIRSRAETRGEAMGHVEQNALQLQRDATDGVRRMLESAHLSTAERGPIALKLRTFDNIAQLADHYFGESNPVRKVFNAIERMRVTSEGIFAKSEPLLRKLVELRSKNAEAFREFSSLLHDATVANVHPHVGLSAPENAHLGKARVVGDAVWSKAQHPELARRYESLPEEYQAAWHSVVKHFRDTQNEMSLGIIENRVLKLLGIEDAALAKRIHEGTATDADRARVGEDMFKVIEEAGELSKIEGPYVPLIRRGDHVVKGDYKIDVPNNAKALAPNEFEFKTDKEASDYAKNSELKSSIKKVWVDEATGETHEVDPTTGDTHKVTAQDLNAVPRYRVTVQNRHVEFIDGKAAAERRAAELAADGNIDVHKVVPRSYEVGGRQATELSASLQRLVSRLEKSEAYKQSTPTQQAALRQAVQEASAASHGSTRIQSKSLPRRGVAGYSEDLVRNMGDYGESSSRYLAKLEHAPALEAAMKDMEEQLKRDHSKVNQYGRTTIRNEVVRRVNGDNGFEQGGKFAPVVKRAMAISFIDKLASPAYSVVNAMQPMMVTMPYLAGKFGVARSVLELGKAYSDISAGQIVKQGLKETGRRLKGGGAPDDFITDAKNRLRSGDEKRLVEHLVENGVVDPSAGMEVKALTKDYTGVGGKIDAGLSYLEGVTREMPRAIEAINRLTTALASYRLERMRGADHDAAVQAAQDAVNNTQFNYSPTNSPPLFNHPLAKMAFQFKKYGQGMYQLIGSQIGKAYRNGSPRERREAVKTLIALAGTHMAMAGAMGLPTEPIKYLVMASGLVGGPQWGDVEDKIRKAAANVFGKTGGEVATRGLPRLLNLDLSRVGLDSVTSFGEPKSNKDADVKSWLFDTLAGPVASLGVDMAKGISNVASGNFEKAAEQMIPIKAASDSLRAYRQLTEGKKSATGRQTSQPYSFTEAAMRAAGFGSGREAEEGAANSSFYRQSKAQKDARSELMNTWITAKPEGKAKAMAAITKWNQGEPPEVRIKPKELTDALRRREKEDSTAVRGIRANKRDKRFLDEGVYNVR